ncbi:MAG: sialidase family protein [Methylococcales bacterium]
MNKYLLYLLISLVGLSTACTTNDNTEMTVSQETEIKQPAQIKPKRNRHSKLADGVISVDIVNANNHLHLLTGKHQQGQKSLWHQSSSDGGKSWSVANKILNNDNLPAKMVRGNDAQIAVQGDNIVVSWMKYVEDARFNAGPMLTARSTNGGQNWQYTATPPDWEEGPHGYIDMAADDHAIHAVWLDSRDGSSETKASQGLRYAQSIDGGDSWQPNKTLDNVTCSCCWNTVKSDISGNAFVLYRDKEPSDLSIGVVNTQQQWQRLNHVGAFNWQFDGCPHIGGSIDFQKTAGKKRLHSVVGSGHPEHLGVHYLYSDDGGKTWSANKQLGDESAIHADIAAHNNGRVIAVWDMMGEDGLAIYATESSDQGANWSSPKQLSKPGLRATHPRVVKTENGFLALWTENNGQHESLATQRL